MDCPSVLLPLPSSRQIFVRFEHKCVCLQVRYRVTLWPLLPLDLRTQNPLAPILLIYRSTYGPLHIAQSVDSSLCNAPRANLTSFPTKGCSRERARYSTLTVNPENSTLPLVSYNRSMMGDCCDNHRLRHRSTMMSLRDSFSVCDVGKYRRQYFRKFVRETNDFPVLLNKAPDAIDKDVVVVVVVVVVDRKFSHSCGAAVRNLRPIPSRSARSRSFLYARFDSREDQEIGQTQNRGCIFLLGSLSARTHPPHFHQEESVQTVVEHHSWSHRMTNYPRERWKNALFGAFASSGLRWCLFFPTLEPQDRFDFERSNHRTGFPSPFFPRFARSKSRQRDRRFLRVPACCQFLPRLWARAFPLLLEYYCIIVNSSSFSCAVFFCSRVCVDVQKRWWFYRQKCKKNEVSTTTTTTTTTIPRHDRKNHISCRKRYRTSSTWKFRLFGCLFVGCEKIRFQLRTHAAP